MTQRDIDERRIDDPRSERDQQDFRSGTQRDRSMTSRDATQSMEASQGGGGWSGYVVPYRYYGPGYRGVGYYSVMYQGRGDDEAPDAGAQGVGQHYGQGTGAGGGWEPESDTNGWRGAGQRGSWRGASAGGWNRSAGTGGWSGGQAGRGPKGYQRSDDRLREDVSDMLMADDQLDASEIEVQVKNGEVTLTGTVEDRWAKRRAEDLAEQAMGVRDVMNQIRVQDAGSMASTGSRQTSRSSSGPGSKSTGGTSRVAADREGQGTNGRSQTTAGSR
jgi:osmotically-inducible protein OsmY